MLMFLRHKQVKIEGRVVELIDQSKSNKKLRSYIKQIVLELLPKIPSAKFINNLKIVLVDRGPPPGAITAEQEEGISDVAFVKGDECVEGKSIIYINVKYFEQFALPANLASAKAGFLSTLLKALEHECAHLRMLSGTRLTKLRRIASLRLEKAAKDETLERVVKSWQTLPMLGVVRLILQKFIESLLLEGVAEYCGYYVKSSTVVEFKPENIEALYMVAKTDIMYFRNEYDYMMKAAEDNLSEECEKSWERLIKRVRRHMALEFISSCQFFT